MKKCYLLLSAIAVLAATACSSPTTQSGENKSKESQEPVASETDVKESLTYTIEGVVSDTLLNNQTLYLNIYPVDKAIDSTTVVDGVFRLSGNIDADRIAYLSINRHRIEFVLEPGEIKIEIGDSCAVSGPVLNQALTELRGNLDSINETYRKKLQEILESDKTLEERMLADQEIANQQKEEFRALLSRTFDNNRNNSIGALIVSQWPLEPAQLDSVLNLAGDALKSNPLVVQLIEMQNNLKKTAEGQPFVDFTIEQPDGSQVSLSDYVGKGKYVLVDFWASWCGPCRREIPNIKELYRKYGGDRFEVLGVAVWDEVADTQRAIQELGIEWPQILNAQAIPTDLYAIEGIPHIILFGPDGTILARDLRGEEMMEKVAEVMEE